MDRIIEVKVFGNHLAKDNKNAGTRGEANVTKLRITFDESWDGYAKEVIFWDAYGQNPTRVVLADGLREENSKRVYLVAIPPEATARAGTMTFRITGSLDNKIQGSITSGLEVKDSPDVLESIPPTPTELQQIQAHLDKTINEMREKIGGYTWHIDTDKVVGADGTEYGALKDCMTDKYSGTWFYAITSTSDKGMATYPEQYAIDGANGYLSLRDYVIWTGDRLVHIPTFEAKASTEKDPATEQYNWTSGVDGLMSSTDKAYLGDLTERFVSACQEGNKNSGNGCGESGLYGNIVSGRPTPVIDKDTPVGNLMAIRDKATKVTSQVLIGETTEKSDSLHYDLWFKGNKDAAQWLRALTSDNFIRFVNTNYTGYVNWAVAPGIYRVKKNSADGDRAFTEEHTMFVIPGAPEPDSAYLATAKDEDRVKMRAHAITQLAVNDDGTVKVRCCPLPNLNNSVSGKCSEWYEFVAGVKDGSLKIGKLDNDLQEAMKQAHTHSNITELDQIQLGDVWKWNNAEQNAKSYTDKKVADIVNSSPEALDTLSELANALGNDENFFTTVLNKIAKKADSEQVEKDIATAKSEAIEEVKLYCNNLSCHIYNNVASLNIWVEEDFEF